jgi:hypothetical protein
MSLQDFKHTKKGAAIGAILARPDALSRMEQFSRADRPAVEAVGADIAAAVGSLDDKERKLVGRWVKELLASRGLIPDRKGRVAPGNLFARGTIYRFVRPVARLGGARRLAAARAILAASPGAIMSSEELIADRRRERS